MEIQLVASFVSLIHSSVRAFYHVGLSYILKLLDQYHAFDSLHWFQACKSHYAAEKRKIQDAAAKAKGDDKLQQTTALSFKRVQVF